MFLRSLNAFLLSVLLLLLLLLAASVLQRTDAKKEDFKVGVGEVEVEGEGQAEEGRDEKNRARKR